MLTRIWDMPNSDTMLVPSIRSFTLKYLQHSKCSVDPFARNCRLATHTNDLNPETAAQHHMDSVDFLAMLERDGVQPDLVIFDPPYSPEQMKRAYESFGLAMNGTDALRTAGWAQEREIIGRIVGPSGVVLSFGWNSCGQGKNRGFQLIETVLVCHGAGHHDTICVAERKLPPDMDLFEPERTR